LGPWQSTPIAQARVRASQATITITTLEDELNNDSDCSLREAIQAANTGLAVDACPAGGADNALNFSPALVVTAPQTLNLTLFDSGADSDEFGPTALAISSTITLAGPITNGITLARSPSITYTFRLLRVTSLGHVTLRNLTLQNGLAVGGKGWGVFDGGAGGGGGAGMGGAIFNEGQLTLENITLRNNKAQGGAGGFGGDGGSGNGGGGVGSNGISGNDTLNPGNGGGPNGGLGNSATPTAGGHGGGGGGTGGNNGSGANGGFGGGGGGGTGTGNSGGDGGFGGGGGGNRAASGPTGLGGFGGGNSDRSAAGGGAGMGGAIFNHSGVVTITNSTLSQNTAEGGRTYGGVATVGHGLGGAIFNLDGALTIWHSTFASNTVSTGGGAAPRTDGGALFNKQLAITATVELHNSIFANTVSTNTDFYNDGGLITGSQSNIIEANAGGGNGAPTSLLIPANGDPNLATLANNGGATWTQALLAPSPALDVNAAGVNGCGTPFALDQRGIIRPQGPACDLGAYETNYYTLTITTMGNGSGIVTPTVGAYPYPAGTVLTLTASANIGSVFAGWSGACSGTGNCVVTITGFQTVAANFSIPTCFAEYTGDAVTDFSSANAQAVRDAVAAANPGSTVKVAGYCAGASLQSGTNQTVLLTKTLTLAGGYTTTDNWAAYNPIANPTTLDALGGGRVLYANVTATVQGLTTINGFLNAGTTPSAPAGGIYGAFALTLTDMVIANNIITGTSTQGGGVWVGGIAAISNTLIANNVARSTGGGARFNAQAYLTNTMFSGNQANGGGGAYFNLGAALWQVTFQSNAARSGVGGGATFISTGSAVTMTDTVFDNNLATGNGGGATINSNTTISRSVFRQNTSGSGGGALYFQNTSPKRLVNVLFSRNQANALGAAINVNNAAPLQLIHVTIVSPTAPTGATEAIYVGNGTAQLTNTLIASHTVGIGQTGGVVSEDYTLFDAVNVPYAGLITSGGHSLTGTAAFYDTTWYTLTAPSAAIDRGGNADVTDDYFGDLRPQGNGYDIGYDESPYAYTPIYTLTVAMGGNGSGIVTPTVGVYTYTYGAVITLTASADFGSTFTGWSGDCSGPGDCVVVMTADRSIIANFATFRLYFPFIWR
jgi:CSLREA domain-containing protein